MGIRKGKTAVNLKFFLVSGILEGNKVAKVPQNGDFLQFAALCNSAGYSDTVSDYFGPIFQSAVRQPLLKAAIPAGTAANLKIFPICRTAAN